MDVYSLLMAITITITPTIFYVLYIIIMDVKKSVLALMETLGMSTDRLKGAEGGKVVSLWSSNREEK